MKLEDYTIKMVDLPGTYSITEYTPEELFVRTHLTEYMPDVVINVIDASNLERNLFLTTELIDMNIQVVIALNMYDELEKKDIIFDYTKLGKMIGIPIVPTVAVSGKGIIPLLEKVIKVYENQEPTTRHIHINYGNTIEDAITHIQKEIKKNSNISSRFSTRYLSIKLLENDQHIFQLFRDCPNYDAIVRVSQIQIDHLEREYDEKSETVITDAKYNFIAGALYETVSENNVKELKKKNDIDFLLTHRVWGFPIFIFFMWAMFQSTFTLGSYPMNWINSGVAYLSQLLSSLFSDGPLKDLLID